MIDGLSLCYDLYLQNDKWELGGEYYHGGMRSLNIDAYISSWTVLTEGKSHMRGSVGSAVVSETTSTDSNNYAYIMQCLWTVL